MTTEEIHEALSSTNRVNETNWQKPTATQKWKVLKTLHPNESFWATLYRWLTFWPKAGVNMTPGGDFTLELASQQPIFPPDTTVAKQYTTTGKPKYE